jgi:hypothetical protein
MLNILLNNAFVSIVAELATDVFDMYNRYIAYFYVKFQPTKDYLEL